MKLLIGILLSVVIISGIGVSYSQSDSVPAWIKNTAGWWSNNEITDKEFFSVIQFLVDREIIIIPNNSDDSKRVLELEDQLSEIKKSTVRDIQDSYDDGYADGSKQITKKVIRNTLNEITIKTDKNSYDYADLITISGSIKTLAEYSQLVTIVVVSPDGNIVTIAQVVPDSDGHYSTSLKAGSTMTVSGDYEISAQYGSAKTTNTFYYSGGVSEQITKNLGDTGIKEASVSILINKNTGIPGCESNNNCFNPIAPIINRGQTVSWVNDDDSGVHTVTSGNPNVGPSEIFDSGILMAGDSFEFTFNEIGDYEYYCMLHPWMIGIVIVE